MKRIEVWLIDNPGWVPYVDLVVYPPTTDEISKEFPNTSKDVLDRCGELVQECGGHVSRGALYVKIRRVGGASDRFATMLALQAPPGINTSDTFWAGRKSWVDVFGETYANNIRKGLANKGISLKAGDEYMPELVRPGYGPKNPDPEAIVPFGGARSYIKSLCEKRGWAVEGAVKAEHREPESDPLSDENCVPMGMDLVRKKACKMVRSDPSLRSKSKAELRQLVLEKHGPSKTKPVKVNIPD